MQEENRRWLNQWPPRGVRFDGQATIFALSAEKDGEHQNGVHEPTVSNSGEGKANQYFLRGFNLDHGSDLAITVAGAGTGTPLSNRARATPRRHRRTCT